jgi:hypothetical protein
MAKEIVREYNLEDEAMLVRAEVIHTQLVADLADFSAKFPFIDDAYQAALQATINTANALPLDNQVLANQKILTEDVNAQVILGRSALKALGIYAKLTYPDSEARQRSFGQDQWADAYNDQEKMMNALEQAHAQATAAPYDADLAAKGFTATDAANLATIANAIRTRNNLQENAKNNRPVSTQDRVAQYNSVWNSLKEVNLASQVVFADNAAKLESYLLYGGSSTGANTIINLTVNATGTGNPLANASVQIVGSALAPQTTNAEGQCTFASVNIAELISLEITSEGGTITEVADLNVNTGTTNEFTVDAEA